MNGKIIAILSLFMLFSCQKITPESTPITNNTSETKFEKKYPNSIPQSYNKNPGVPCGTHSCDMDKYLREKFGDGSSVPGLKTYQERLSVLLDKYKDHYQLITSDDLKKFTDDYYLEYFGCDANVYDCSYDKRKYDEDTLNYVFYVFIPQMVIDEYIVKRNGDDMFAEDIIQAIKRKDFISNDLKESRVSLYGDKLDEFIEKNIDLSNYDKEKLLSDNTYFYEKILKPNEGLHDVIFLKMVDPAYILLDWTQEGQLEKLARTTVDRFYKLAQQIGFDQKVLEQKIIEIYGYEKNIDIKESIKNDVLKKSQDMIEKYKLSEKMMSDRYLRYDELFIYTGKNFKDTFEKYAGKGNEVQFYKDVGEIGSRELLLFNLGVEEEYYYLPPRLKFYNDKNTFYITNLFKIYKYADEHRFKPNAEL